MIGLVEAMSRRSRRAQIKPVDDEPKVPRQANAGVFKLPLQNYAVPGFHNNSR